MDFVITIPALGDNLIYLYRYNQSDCLAVDPGESVLKILREQDLSLKMILVTHHHWDHIGGVAELKKRSGCKVVGGDKVMPAFRTFLRAVLEASEATCMPDAGVAESGSLTRFDSLEAYQSEVLGVGY